MSEYFKNEIWDTGGDGRISITGDIYSTANPLSIYVGEAPVKSVEFSDGGINVIGALLINGAPLDVSVDVADLVPGIFGANQPPDTFSFENGLNISGDLNLTGYLQSFGNGWNFANSPSYHYSADLTIQSTGGSRSTTLTLDTQNSTLTLQAYEDSNTPANSYNFIGAVKRLEINSNEDILLASGADVDITTGGSGKVTINGNPLPSLNFQSTTVSGATSVDWDQGAVQRLTLNASATITFSNPVAGRTYVLVVVQGTGGSRVPTLTGWDFGDNPPTWSTTVGAKDVVTAVYDGSEYLASIAVINA